MASVLDSILGLFKGSRSLNVVPFYTLRRKASQWKQYRKYPTYYELPAAISFPLEFWTRIAEIHRYTKGDKHERAISVWWADGEFVLTDNVKGQESRVVIPRQKILVSYKPVKGTKRMERIITVNGKRYGNKRTVDVESVRRIKKIEVEHLFNMHTHPPREKDSGSGVEPYYNFFSWTDIKGLLNTSGVFNGLVTDKLWLLAKTGSTPTSVPDGSSISLTPEYLTKELHIKVYKAQFGKSAVVVRPDDYL